MPVSNFESHAINGKMHPTALLVLAICFMQACKLRQRNDTEVKDGPISYVGGNGPVPSWTDPATGIVWNYGGVGNSYSQVAACKQFENSDPPELIKLKAALANGRGLGNNDHNANWALKDGTNILDSAVGGGRIWVKPEGTTQPSLSVTGAAIVGHSLTSYFHIVCQSKAEEAAAPVVAGLHNLYLFSDLNERNFGYGTDDLTTEQQAQGFKSHGALFKVQTEFELPDTFQVIVCEDHASANNRFLADNAECDGKGRGITYIQSWIYKSQVPGSIAHCRGKTSPYRSYASPQGCSGNADQIGWVFPLAAPAPGPQSTATNDPCPSHTLASQCQKYAVAELGCRWDDTYQTCYNVHDHQCDFYSRFGFRACNERLVYDRGCRWQPATNKCVKQ